MRSITIAKNHGFTLIEIIMVIVILGVLATTVAVKWPSNMEQDAAILDFIRAVRYAQHMALTRVYTTPDKAWGIDVTANRYTVRTADGSSFGNPDYVNHALPANIPLTGGPIYFNGLGEPIFIPPAANAGAPLTTATNFNIGTTSVTVFPETGYVE